jgi:hypothetical protein
MLTANQKYIDTANIKHLLGAGEKNADKIQIAVDRYYHQTDLSDCLFTLRAVNSGGGLVMQDLEKEVTESQIILTWTITEDFTAVSGQLLPEIVGQKDDTVVIKYEMTPMIVRNSILEQYNGGIDAIDKALREMQSILAQAEQLIAKAPIIQNGTWWLYDAATGAYQDSGQPAKGDKGETGEKGDPGKQGKTGAKGEKGEKGDAGTPGKNGVNGKNGADGYSPTATVTETDTGATITITDKNGTTTATIKNGTSGETASWGDYTPGCEEGESAKYCTAKLVTVYGKQTWQILPSISTVSHNALGIVTDGLFVLDLSPDVDTLKASAHTHDNKEALDSITSDKITTWDGYSEEIQTVKNGLVGKKDQNSSYITGEIFNEYKKNKATGYASHSEGSTTTASGNCSHSEGCDTTASGRTSHAEGYFTIASGDYSHSEGFNTTASGITSHAEGNVTTASGNHSHSEGNYTIASSSYQHVQGQFNVEDSDSKYSFIIGNGKDNNNRSNAFAIDWNGKIYIGNDTDGVDVSALAITIAELQSQLNRKTIQFRHGKGTLTATANGTNVVWQYGGQQVQGGSCTFDVKSDNGLITLECDTIESLTIKNDTTNKMDLSDLGGKIASVLSLESCPNITGDLSDLGGKITNWLSLDNCPNITGDLSDLGGKITNWLSLKGCRNITGDLSDLGSKIASMLNLGYCSNITGVYSGTKYPKTFAVSKTAITSANMDANLINFAASGVKSGTFTATGMKRTAASDNAVATLVTNGWTVSGLTKEG